MPTATAQQCGYSLTRDMTPIDDYYQDGDLIIGYISALHRTSGDRPCTRRGLSNDFQKAHALKYLAEKYNNNNSELLPNTTVGLLFLDTCVNSIIAVSRAMQMAGTTCFYNQTVHIPQQVWQTDHDPLIRRPSYKVAGVIGTGFSFMSMAINPILSVYHIPQVCFASSQDSLSNKKAYPYFSRTTSATHLYTVAISRLVQHFNWTYIAILYKDDSFGYNARLATVKILRENGICVAFEKEVPSGTYHMVVQQLLVIKNLRVIVVYTYSGDMKEFYKALANAGATHKFIIILSGSFSSSTYTGYEDLFAGTFSFGAIQGRHSEFEDYYSKVSPWSDGPNDWFGQYYPEDVGCQWNPTNSSITNCNQYKSMTDFPGFSYKKWYPFVMDAFQVFVHALHNLITAECPDAFGDRVALTKCVDGPMLLKYIRRVKFQGITKYIEFDEKGDIYAGLNLRYFRKVGHASYQLDVIGAWDRKQDSILLYDDIEWYLSGYNSSVEGPVPESVCAHPCGVGEFYIQGEMECCWECRRCRDNEYIRDDLQGCETCPNYTWPNQTTFMSCQDIQLTFMLWTDWSAIGLESLSCLGLLICHVIIAMFVKFSKKKIIKGSSQELMMLIILGLVFAFTCPLVYIAQPTTATCYFTYGGFHLSCTLLFGPLLLKTLRMYRIFSAADNLQLGIRLVDMQSQIMLMLFIIIAQVCILV